MPSAHARTSDEPVSQTRTAQALNQQSLSTRPTNLKVILACVTFVDLTAGTTRNTVQAPSTQRQGRPDQTWETNRRQLKSRPRLQSFSSSAILQPALSNPRSTRRPPRSRSTRIWACPRSQREPRYFWINHLQPILIVSRLSTLSPESLSDRPNVILSLRSSQLWLAHLFFVLFLE